MRIFTLIAVAALASSAAAAPYRAPAETAALKPGPNVEVANRYCRACHSADYITTQPPKVAAGFWQASVSKMVNVFAAPIPAEDQGKIVAYLNAIYREPAP